MQGPTVRHFNAEKSIFFLPDTSTYFVFTIIPTKLKVVQPPASARMPQGNFYSNK